MVVRIFSNEITYLFYLIKYSLTIESIFYILDTINNLREDPKPKITFKTTLLKYNAFGVLCILCSLTINQSSNKCSPLFQKETQTVS